MDANKMILYSIQYKTPNGELREITRRVTMAEADKMLLEILKMGTVVKSSTRKDSSKNADFSIKACGEKEESKKLVTKPIPYRPSLFSRPITIAV